MKKRTWLVFFLLFICFVSLWALDRPLIGGLLYDHQTDDSLYVRMWIHTPAQAMPGNAIAIYYFWPFWGMGMDGNTALWPGETGYFSYVYTFGTTDYFPIVCPKTMSEGIHSFQALYYQNSTMVPIGDPLDIYIGDMPFNMMNWDLLVHSANQNGITLRLRISNPTNTSWEYTFPYSPVAVFSVNGVMPDYVTSDLPTEIIVYAGQTYYLQMQNSQPVTDGIYNLQAYLVGTELADPIPVADPIHLEIGNIDSLEIGNSSDMASVPISFGYHHSLYECIINSSEFGNRSFHITTMEFFNSFTEMAYEDTPVQIFMGETSQNDLSGGWISADEFQLVYDGVLNFPLGQNSILLNLDSAFYHHSGQNLAIMFKRSSEANSPTSSGSFFCHPGSTMNGFLVYADQEFDPYNPPAEFIATGTIPNFRFYYTGCTATDDPQQSPAPDALGVFPNPFVDRCTLEISIGKETEVNLQIYNLKGQLVRELGSAKLPSGTHLRSWDGRDENGKDAPSGVYLIKMQSDKRTFCHKLCLLR